MHTVVDFEIAAASCKVKSHCQGLEVVERKVTSSDLFWFRTSVLVTVTNQRAYTCQSPSLKSKYYMYHSSIWTQWSKILNADLTRCKPFSRWRTYLYLPWVITGCVIMDHPTQFAHPAGEDLVVENPGRPSPELPTYHSYRLSSLLWRMQKIGMLSKIKSIWFA